MNKSEKIEILKRDFGKEKKKDAINSLIDWYVNDYLNDEEHHLLTLTKLKTEIKTLSNAGMQLNQ